MNYREYTENLEQTLLSPYAVKSSDSKGRYRYEEKDDIRTDFMRDRDRIIHCKAFRRLKHKTQVFISPEGDHYRTRLTHTLEVAQIARTIARALRLNEDLTEAIALGHDLGHTPFGHSGERAIREVANVSFNHNVQSVRVLQVLEKQRKGLNITKEVLDGIENHTWSGNPSTLEGKIVRYADVIAYINHDIDDAIMAGVIKQTDLPEPLLKILGQTHGDRISTLIMAIVDNSFGKDMLVMEPFVEQAMLELKEYMFTNVYFNSIAKLEEQKAIDLIKMLYRYFDDNKSKIPEEYFHNQNDKKVAIIDYLSSMTDSYAISIFNDVFVPYGWNK
ncbi:MAG: deoxyguanosinetriphosphate triphosphohydrolase [Clostridia bacterium]